MPKVSAQQYHYAKRAVQFFLVSSSHDSLLNMLSVNFAMMQNFHYSLSDLEGMIPWERRVYIDLLMQHLKEERERMEEMKAQKGM